MKLAVALSLACAAALPAACGASLARETAGALSSCKGAQLSGRFAAIAGSAGAGNISYALTLKNVSKVPCTVSGLPAGQLLGRRGGKLPTHIRAEHPNELSAVLVRLQPGASARATARFSPDVPGHRRARHGQSLRAGRLQPARLGAGRWDGEREAVSHHLRLRARAHVLLRLHAQPVARDFVMFDICASR